MEYFSPIANGIGLIFLAIGIFLALRMLRISDQPNERNLMLAFLRVSGWSLLSIGVLFVSGILLFALAVPFWAVAMIVLLMALNRFYRNQRQSLLRVLVLATARQLPLAPAVAAFSREAAPGFNNRAWKLAGALQAGMSLAGALRATRGVLPRSAIPAVYVGEATGTVSQTLREASQPSEANHALQQVVTHIFYLGNVIFFGLMILAFMMIKIVPEFRKIFADFETDLPPSTELLISASDLFLEAGLLTSLIMPVALLLTLYVTLRYLGWIDWDPPPLNRFMRAVDVGNILRLLSVVVENQKSLTLGIDALAASYPKTWVRLRLENVALDVSQGRDWCEAFREHGLIGAADAAVLASAQRVGNLAWAMRLAADSGERRLAYRLRVYVQVVAPLLLLALGAVVCFFIVSLFLPLISLIMKLV